MESLTLAEIENELKTMGAEGVNVHLNNVYFGVGEAAGCIAKSARVGRGTRFYVRSASSTSFIEYMPEKTVARAIEIVKNAR